MNTNSVEPWKQGAEQFQSFQQALGQGFAQAMEAFKGLDVSGMGPGLPHAGAQLPRITFVPAKLQEVQQTYLRESAELWNSSLTGTLKPNDKRFAAKAWSENKLAAFTAGAYLLNARTLLSLVEATDCELKVKNRLRFAIDQWIAASAPSNFLALNPDAQMKAVESKGESIANGVKNLIHDIQQGHVSMTDMKQFEVGRNVATTEGAVVFENDVFQLIEYKPSTAKVHERPFLMVPPCINKFYILDLQPENSLVKFAVDQGHHTFLVSWRNPDKAMENKTWDDYVEDGVIKAISVVQDVTDADTINALGFCVGGTLTTSALAVLAARKKKPVHSLTLLTTLLDFSDTGIMDVFIDEQTVKYREMEIGNGGLLQGQSLASTFSFLRPNDLVWSYVVGNYLKGETPPAFDLLYWNSDSTNLPGPFYAWYLRNTYLENNLVEPGKTVICGEAIDLNRVDLPVYIYGSREDHIVPIEGAYQTTHVLPGKKRFVMGASGHIAGVINPPVKKKRNYWTHDALPAGIDDWLDGATEHPGSWWTDWAGWLKSQGGKQVAAPTKYGKGAKYKAIEPAPGRYVKAKAKPSNATHFLQA
ncbi:MAG: class I poly(R)-hydroxyalkanoic acid synthase [Burkholderiales bacterium]